MFKYGKGNHKKNKPGWGIAAEHSKEGLLVGPLDGEQKERERVSGEIERKKDTTDEQTESERRDADRCAKETISMSQSFL